MGLGDAGFEPRTAGQQSGALPLTHHAPRNQELYVYCSIQVDLHLYSVYKVIIKGVATINAKKKKKSRSFNKGGGWGSQEWAARVEKSSLYLAQLKSIP